MRNHYNKKEELLSQVKVQVDIVHSTIQKRYLYIYKLTSKNVNLQIEKEVLFVQWIQLKVHVSQFQLFVYLCIGRMNIFDIYFCYHLKLTYHKTHLEHLVCIVQFLFTFFIWNSMIEYCFLLITV